jgi:hypothetical protein
MEKHFKVSTGYKDDVTVCNCGFVTYPYDSLKDHIIEQLQTYLTELEERVKMLENKRCRCEVRLA